MKIETIREEIIRLSGSGKRISSLRTHGIYTSFTLPGLDDMAAVRDTKQRFIDFVVPERLDGKTVIDVGCNVGAVSFEFARRGAKVIGLEYRGDRVLLCEAIAKHYDLDCTFYAVDLNVGDSIADVVGKCDIVWCSSVDEYISDLQRFYAMLRKICVERLYMESNLQGPSSEYVANSLIQEAGFVGLRYVGNGHSGGISRKRKMFKWDVWDAYKVKKDVKDVDDSPIVTPADIEKEIGR